MIVRCNTRCWDAGRCRRYYPGDQDDIDPLEPIAAYFDFPAGTEVYHKIKGTKKTPVKETTRIVPGAKPPEEKNVCPKCNKNFDTPMKLRGHNMTCKPAVNLDGTLPQV